VFAANEPGRHLPAVWQAGPGGGAYNNVQTCKQSTRNVEPFFNRERLPNTFVGLICSVAKKTNATN